MKRFLYILGAGLCVLVVLSALLFIQAQTPHFSEGAGERAPWISLLGAVFVTSLLSVLVFFLISFQKNDTLVTPPGSHPGRQSGRDTGTKYPRFFAKKTHPPPSRLFLAQ